MLAREVVAQSDPVGGLIDGVFRALREASTVMARVEHSLQVVRGYGSTAGRVSSLAGDCKCCLRPVAGGARDPIRNGYCDACRKAFVRYSDDVPVGDDPAAHRSEFERWRRARLGERQDVSPAEGMLVRCGEGHWCCRRRSQHEHLAGSGERRRPEDCADCVAALIEERES